MSSARPLDESPESPGSGRTLRRPSSCPDALQIAQMLKKKPKLGEAYVFWRACRRQLVQSQEDLCYYRRRLIWSGYTCYRAILSESESLTPLEHKAKKLS